MKVIITPKGQSDLRDIGRWIARDNRPRSKTYVAELRQKCLSLGQFPERSPVVAHRREPVRRTLHGAYAIFYVVRPERVVVLSVVNAARLQSPGQIE
ncbi:type II toxin-antitoxin system RelE/ParE family toxin [Brevundimonas sp.]